MGLAGRHRFTGGRRCILWALQPFSFAHFDMDQGRLVTKGRELRIYRHSLELRLHGAIAVMLREELLEGTFGLKAVQAIHPTVEGEHSRGSIGEKENKQRPGKGFAPGTRYRFRGFFQHGGGELYPRKARKSPYERDSQACLSAYIEGLVDIAPGHNAESAFPKPRGEIFERRAECGRHRIDDKRRGVLEAVQRKRDEHAAYAVNWRERPPNEADAAFPTAIDEIAHDGFEDEPQDAAHRENEYEVIQSKGLARPFFVCWYGRCR